MESIDQLKKMLEVLQAQQQEGEKPLDTLYRVLLPPTQPTEPAPVVTPPTVESPVPQPPTPAPAVVPVPAPPPVAPAPTGPLYRFKTYEKMNRELTNVFGTTWQSAVNPQGLLDRLYGHQPTDPAVQAGLHKTYTSQPDTGSGFVQLDDGKQALYVKMMLEKIS